MKLYVEMTEKEYEDYKQFLNGTHDSQEHNNLNSLKALKVPEFLKLKGFKQGLKNSLFDDSMGRTVEVAEFTKDDVTVIIREKTW